MYQTFLFFERIGLDIIEWTSKSYPILYNHIDWIVESFIYFFDMQHIIIPRESWRIFCNYYLSFEVHFVRETRDMCELYLREPELAVLRLIQDPLLHWVLQPLESDSDISPLDVQHEVNIKGRVSFLDIKYI